MTTPAEALPQVLTTTGPVLLDFDGPVTHLFINGRNRMVADRMREVTLRHGLDLPEKVRDTEDPLIVLRWAAAEMPEHREEIETACVLGEVDAVADTEPTPGGLELLQAAQRMRRPVIIVSNNAPETIQAYLDRFELHGYITHVVARRFGRSDLMKPHPDAINRALAVLGQPANRCVLIGDSVSDVQVANHTGVRSIGFAKTIKRGDELRAAGADATVDTMTHLAEQLAITPGHWHAFQEPHGRWTLITVPGLGVTQARYPGEVDTMTRSLVATWLDTQPDAVTISWLTHRPAEADYA